MLREILVSVILLRKYVILDVECTHDKFTGRSSVLTVQVNFTMELITTQGTVEIEADIVTIGATVQQELKFVLQNCPPYV